MDEVINSVEIPNFIVLAEECLERLRCNNYSKFTLQQYTWTLRHLQRYMDKQGVLEYTPDIGYNFINSLKSSLSERTVKDKARAIHYLDRYCSEVYPQSSITTISTLPEEFQTAINDYLIICQSKGNVETTLTKMLMYGKEASNRKQEIDRQHHTIPNQRNQRPKDKHYGNVHNRLWNHG